MTAPKKMGGRRPGAGRKRKQPDFETVIKNAAAYQLTVPEIAALAGLSRASLHRRLDEEPALREAYEAGRALGSASLKRKLYQRAMTGATAELIFANKVMAGLSEKIVVTPPSPAKLFESWVADLGILNNDELNFMSTVLEKLCHGR